MDGATVSKVLAEKWKAMDTEGQQHYYQEAERLKNLHQILGGSGRWGGG